MSKAGKALQINNREETNMPNYTIAYEKQIAGLGSFALRPLQIPEDIDQIYHWVSQPYAKFWGLQGYSVQQVEEAYRRISDTVDVFLGLHNGEPVFLMEPYHPAHDPISEHYPVEPGDRGMHVLVAPTQRPIANFVWAVFRVVMEFLFSNPQVTRVVVEPDIRNNKIHALNERAGFEYQKIIQLANKTAHLAFCTRAQYFAAIQRDENLYNQAVAASPGLAVSHVRRERWQQVNRLHVHKAISGFAHESLIEPMLQQQEGEWGSYLLVADRPEIEYRFRAQIRSLDHWHIDPDSVQKFVDGQEAPQDLLAFIIEFNERLGMKPSMLPTYLEEIVSTLYGSAYKFARQAASAAQLTYADFQQVAGAMMEGHPSFDFGGSILIK